MKSLLTGSLGKRSLNGIQQLATTLDLMENISTTISIETRISKALVPLLNEPLHALAAQFQRAKISMVTAKNNGKSSKKTPFSQEFGLNARHFNSVKNEVNSLFDSQTSNLQRYIVEAETIEPMMKHGASEKEVTDCIAKQSQALIKFQKETKDNLLTDFGQALTYRFKRDNKSWRVILSISSDNDVEYVTSKNNGNEHHISYVQINSCGNQVACDDLYFRNNDYNDTSKQVTTGLGEAVKVLIEQAKATGCPIVVEHLDFKKAKSQIKSGKDKKFNKTVSSLVTAKFLSMLTLRCAENAIELIKAKPAYTSLIGRLKYANQFSNNIHQAAAMVIARRGAGFSDRKLPRFTMCVVLNKPTYFRTPEDCSKKTIWDQLKLVKQQYNTWFTQTLEMLRAARKARTPSIDLELDVPF